MLKIGVDNKLKKIEMVLEGIALIERETGKSVQEHLDFGGSIDPNLIGYNVASDGHVYIGELDGNGYLHGRGI